MRSGQATVRHLRRYSASHESTFARWYASDFAVVSLNTAALTAVIPPEHAQAWVMEASVVPQSGQKT
jgi:DDE superfamily endonuclease